MHGMRRPQPLIAEAQQHTLRLAWMPALTAWAPGTSVDIAICSSGSSSWFSWRHRQSDLRQVFHRQATGAQKHQRPVVTTGVPARAGCQKQHLCVPTSLAHLPTHHLLMRCRRRRTSETVGQLHSAPAHRRRTRPLSPAQPARTSSSYDAMSLPLRTLMKESPAHHARL